MNNRFLTITWNPQFDETKTASFMTEAQIISFVDMRDCHDEKIQVFDLAPETPTKLEVHGAWHDPSDPLYIKLTDPAGTTIISGYGTDH